MAYTIAELVADVRKVMDEAAVNGSEFTADGAAGVSEVDDAELDELIRSRIVDARNFVLGGCDVNLLWKDCSVLTGTQVAGTVFNIGDGEMFKGLRVVIGTAPNGAATSAGNVESTVGKVLRLVSVRGDSWMRGVGEFVAMDSKDYPMLLDEYATGTPESPKAAEGYDMEGKRVVEMFSWEAGAVEHGYVLRYVRGYELEEMEAAGTGGDVKVEDLVLRGAVRYYLAGLVCEVLGDARKDDFFHLATVMMGVSGGDGS